MDKTLVKYFLEYKGKICHEVHSYHFNANKTMFQIVFVTDINHIEDLSLMTFYTKTYIDWEKFYYRRKKIKEICSKLEI